MSDDSEGLGLLACVDGDPVGLLSMFTFEADSGRAFIGARFVPEAQGKGYGTDAVGRLVEYGFDERRLHRVGAGARADNDASRAMLETLGFVEEGRHREHYYVEGEYVDRITYGLLESEWQAG